MHNSFRMITLKTRYFTICINFAFAKFKKLVKVKILQLIMKFVTKVTA